MADHPGTPPPSHAFAASETAEPTPAANPSIFRLNPYWKLGTVAGAIMLLLALVGVGLTTSRSEFALKFWIWLVPIYGLLCIGTAGARGWHTHGLRQLQFFRQIAHWLGIGVAVWLVFIIRGSGEETSEAAALNAMMLLALGCYLAGVHLEWHFAVVGVVLTLALLVVAKATQYSWMIFVIGGVAIVAMLGWRWLLARWHARKATP
jgi:hypothetical protein